MAMNPRSRRRRSQAHRSWSGPRPSPANDPSPPRRRRPPSPRSAPAASIASILDDFTESWDRGEPARLESYVDRLAPEDMAELIYHEYCLAESSDLGPDPADYLRRFPDHSEALARLFALHSAVSIESLRRLVEPTGLPEAGDSIGPYFLARELGRGAFARVFLARQADLGDRSVVVKVSSRPSSEPSLLARARHAHIVEVIRQEKTGDGSLHLVSMPFLGGATLAAVLDSRRKLGRKPRTGLDLLADLDRVSAPEYPDAELPRPAREIVAGLSHAQGMAWIVARLAEALDHAHGRGVSHGDLKPSNILLTAEATPMLFDFNLAFDGREPEGQARDAGGTLAYMAPERLMAIAGGLEAGAEHDRHRADLYAMGLVLLEALTGLAPEGSRLRAADPRRTAETLARSRASALPDGLNKGRQARSIPPALRSILARCLAPDPLDRYARGNELAEDLDNWRADRPLRFAVEPRRSELTRQIRRNRVPLVALAITLATAVAVGSVAFVAMEGTRRDRAVAKLADILDRPDSGALNFSKVGRRYLDGGPGDPAELARRQLDRYDVVTDPRWRDRDDIRALPGPDRADLEAWMLEQSYRLAVALGQRPDSPADWRRGLSLIDRTMAIAPLPSIRAERRVLQARLNQRSTGPEPEPDPARVPRWLENYLAGVAAEPDHARDALSLYEQAVGDRPDFFWAHYRAACAACRINEVPVAIQHIRYCVGRRPESPMLHAQLGSLIFRDDQDNLGLGRRDRLYEEALAECDRALSLAPDFAEATQIRAKILHASGQTESASAAIDRFGMLRKLRGLPGAALLRWEVQTRPGPNVSAELLVGIGRQRLLDDPEDVEGRAVMADGLLLGGQTEQALAEFDRVLEANPDHIRARLHRAAEIFRTDRASALAEYAELIESPRFEEVFNENPTAIRAFHFVAKDLLVRGKPEQALEVAERALRHVLRSRSFRAETFESRSKTGYRTDLDPRGECYYVLAIIHAKRAEDHPEAFGQLFEALERCFERDLKFRDQWVAKDSRFDAMRGVIHQRFKELSPVR